MSLSFKSPVINLEDKKSISEFKKKIDIFGHEQKYLQKFFQI